MESIEVVYEVEPRSYVRAYRAHLWRKVGGWLIAAGCVLALALAMATSDPWFSGLITGCALVYLLMVAKVYRQGVHLARTRGRTRVELAIAESGLTFRSERGEVAMPWSRLLGVARRGEFFELDLGKGEAPVWLPAAAVAGRPIEAIEELRNRSHRRPAADPMRPAS
jgi:hypothetical protein